MTNEDFLCVENKRDWTRAGPTDLVRLTTNELPLFFQKAVLETVVTSIVDAHRFHISGNTGDGQDFADGCPSEPPHQLQQYLQVAWL